MNEYQTLLPLHMYLYFTFVTLFIREQTRYKNTKINWITCQILSFSVSH